MWDTRPRVSSSGAAQGGGATFSDLWVSRRSMFNCFEKFKRRVRNAHQTYLAAGTEARPTELFMVYEWAEGP
jgi:hypothetical protein